jgi:hypothetical protein
MCSFKRLWEQELLEAERFCADELKALHLVEIGIDVRVVGQEGIRTGAPIPLWECGRNWTGLLGSFEDSVI